LEFVKRENKLPLKTVFAFACLLRFYRGDWNGESLPLNDDAEIMAEFAQIWKSKDLEMVADKALKNSGYWGEDLTEVNGLTQAITSALDSINTYGIQEGFEEFSKKIK
jgi:tagaturonate reductase